MSNREKLLERASELGWKGVDASLEISLFEYGFIWIYRPKLDDYLCIIGTNYDDDRQEFDEFSIDWFDERAFDDFSDHIENAGFIQSMDIQEGEWLDRNIDDVPYMIYETILYYGCQEVVDASGLVYSVDEILAYITQKKWMR